MNRPPEHKTGPGLRDFTHRVVIVVLIAGFAFLLWHLRHTIILAFASVVVAVVIAAAAEGVERLLPIGRRWALFVAICLILIAIALLGWFVWPQIKAQSADLLQRLPEAATTFEERTGIPLPEVAGGAAASDGGGIGGLWGELTSVLQKVASAVTGFVLVVVAGVFLAVNPRLYRDGFVLLFPPRQHEKARSALDRTGHALKMWLMGMLAAMAIIGTLVGLGTWMIGLPTPLALGSIAFLLEFVPLIGPFVGAVPGLLLALGQDTTTLLWTAALYLAIQQIESNLVTPLIQRRMVTIPPALFMLSVVAMGALFGILGVALAGPLTVAAFVLIRALYVEETLGEYGASENGP